MIRQFTLVLIVEGPCDPQFEKLGLIFSFQSRGPLPVTKVSGLFFPASQWLGLGFSTLPINCACKTHTCALRGAL